MRKDHVSPRYMEVKGPKGRPYVNLPAIGPAVNPVGEQISSPCRYLHKLEKGPSG